MQIDDGWSLPPYNRLRYGATMTSADLPGILVKYGVDAVKADELPFDVVFEVLTAQVQVCTRAVMLRQLRAEEIAQAETEGRKARMTRPIRDVRDQIEERKARLWDLLEPYGAKRPAAKPKPAAAEPQVAQV